MASLFTNVSAMTALQTLSSVSKNLSDTQNRISTGLRINTASDNAAYWSIATTLRSDVGALGAVSDALGLGAATVDTVYTGLNNSKDLLNQIKAKLVAATQPGVPREQIQAEIGELQNRLKDGSSSTVINSESWLTQDSSASGYNSTKSVVGSFTRANGAVTIDTINIDISKTKLYENNSTLKDGANSALNDVTAGALKIYSDAVAAATTSAGVLETNRTAILGALKLTTAFAAGANTLTLGGSAGGGTVTQSIEATAGAAGTAGSVDFVAAAAGNAADVLGTDAAEALEDSINDVLAKLGAFAHSTPQAGTGTLGDYDTDATFTPEQQAAISKAVTDSGNQINKLINDAYDKAANDKIAAARTAYTTAAEANTDNSNLGIFDKVRTVVSSEDGTFSKAISVANIDISKLTDTDFDKGVLQAYVQAVDDAIQEVTLSASVLGAAKSRIEGNQTFVKALVDANNRGIGQLVDADLNEESTKLKALQTQQQLAVQSLSIANSSSDSILQLFR